MSERNDTKQMAADLQQVMDDLYDENDRLKGQNDSYRAGFEAVSAENEALRTSREKIIRRVDAALRENHLLKTKIRQIQSISGEAIHAIEPEPRQDANPASLRVVQRGPA